MALGGERGIVDHGLDPVAATGVHLHHANIAHNTGESHRLAYLALAHRQQGHGIGDPERVIRQGVRARDHAEAFQRADPTTVGQQLG